MSNKFSKAPFKYQHPITSTPPHKHLIITKLHLFTNTPHNRSPLPFAPHAMRIFSGAGGTTAINAGDAHYGRHAGFTGSNTQRYINLVNYTTENK